MVIREVLGKGGGGGGGKGEGIKPVIGVTSFLNNPRGEFPFKCETWADDTDLHHSVTL